MTCRPCHCQIPAVVSAEPRRKRSGLFSVVLQIALLYVMLVFGGGTLINTGHPVAIEVGKLLHVITFVEPTTSWAAAGGFDGLAHGLRTLSSGVTFG